MGIAQDTNPLALGEAEEIVPITRAAPVLKTRKYFNGAQLFPSRYKLDITLDNFHVESQNKISELCPDKAPTQVGGGSAETGSWSLAAVLTRMMMRVILMCSVLWLAGSMRAPPLSSLRRLPGTA